MNEQHASVPAISKSRLEFLFDGVFAIAMTLLVLELKVPDLVDLHSVPELARALAHRTPTFVSYLFSFMMLGIFWYRHNRQYPHFRVITRSMLMFHFVQLAAAAFFPFCAALLGRYPTNHLTIVVYSGCILVYSLGSLANWVVAARSGCLGPEITETEFLRARSKLIRGSLILATLFVIYLFMVVTS